jgi:ribonuclease P protein component
MRKRFPKAQRVVHSNEFTLILRRGVCVADGTLVMFAVRDAGSRPLRLGITIPKKTGNAVVRNRWKRLIRESYRIQQHSLPDGLNVVVRPKKDAKADWMKIKKAIPSLVQRAAKKLA